MIFLWMVSGSQRIQKIVVKQIKKGCYQYPLYRWEMYERKHSVICSNAKDINGNLLNVSKDKNFIYLKERCYK